MSTDRPGILVIDENPARFQTIRVALPDLGSDPNIRHAASVQALVSELQNHCPDIILCAPDCPTLSLPLVRQLLTDQAVSIPLIAVTDVIARKNIVDLIRLGADDVADFLQAEHLALVTATHLGAVDRLRNHWRLREDSAEASVSVSASGEAAAQPPPESDQQVWREKLLQAVKAQQFSLSQQHISSLHVGEDDQRQRRDHIDILLRLNVESNEREARLPAARFLEEARKAGLSPLIDVWVIERACQQLKKMNAAGKQPILFVRLEPSTIEGPKLANFVEKSLRHYGCDANGLAFELPQDTYSGLSEMAQQQLRGIRELGCLLSMSYCGLREPFTDWPEGLTPQFIKLSPKELSRLSFEEESIKSLGRVVEVMHRASVEVIAPHVEHADALAMFWSAGVDYAQGFYHSHPTVVMTSGDSVGSG